MVPPTAETGNIYRKYQMMVVVPTTVYSSTTRQMMSHLVNKLNQLHQWDGVFVQLFHHSVFVIRNGPNNLTASNFTVG